MRRRRLSLATLLTLALLAGLTIPGVLATPALAGPGYPVQGDTLGLGSDGLGSLTGATSVVTDNAGGLTTAGTNGVLRLATSGQVLPTAVPSPGTNVVERVVDGVQSEAYTVFATDTHLHISAPDGSADYTGDDLGVQPTSLAVDRAAPSTGGRVVYALVGAGGSMAVVAVDPGSRDPSTWLLNEFQVRDAFQVLVAPDHTLLLLSGSRLYRYTTQGVLVGQATLKDQDGTAPGATGPAGFAVDGAGTLFAASPTSQHVMEFALDGTFLGEFGDAPQSWMDPSTPRPAGVFDAPTSVTVDCRGRLWLLDVLSGKGRVIAFTGVAKPIGTCAPGLTRTATVADDQAFQMGTDRVGNVFTTAYGVMHKDDRTGHRLTSWGTAQASSTDPKGYGVVGGMAVTTSGDVLVSAGRYCTFDSSGNCTGVFNGSYPGVRVYHAVGTFVTTVTAAGLGQVFNRPATLGVRPSDGHVFVYDLLLGDIRELTPTYAFVRQITLHQVSGVTPTVRAILFDKTGQPLVSVVHPLGTGGFGEGLFEGALQVYSTLGAWVKDLPVPFTPDSVAPPAGIVVLPDGSMIWSAYDPSQAPVASSGVLFKVLADGTLVRPLSDGLLLPFASPRMSLDCGGSLVVTDAGRYHRFALGTGGSCVWKPTAVTGLLVSRTTTSLRVRGYSNPASQVTRMRVLWGPTATHGHATAWITLPSDNVQLTRDTVISGLLSKHTYHYAVQITNASGTVTGVDRTATTS